MIYIPTVLPLCYPSSVPYYYPRQAPFPLFILPYPRLGSVPALLPTHLAFQFPTYSHPTQADVFVWAAVLGCQLLPHTHLSAFTGLPHLQFPCPRQGGCAVPDRLVCIAIAWHALDLLEPTFQLPPL